MALSSGCVCVQMQPTPLIHFQGFSKEALGNPQVPPVSHCAQQLERPLGPVPAAAAATAR